MAISGQTAGSLLNSTQDQASNGRPTHTAVMDSRLEKAIAYIEAHLSEVLTLTQIADAAHLSSFHFARFFRGATGQSVMAYVRQRRLSMAVEQLREGSDPVVDVALACGFGSHEAFTRTFTGQFGVSPITFRRNRKVMRPPTQGVFRMSESTNKPEPNFEQREVFTVVGFAGEFAPGATQDIGALWGQFAPRMGSVPNRVGEATFGVCCISGEGERDMETFTYVAGVQTDGLAEVPDGMMGLELAAANYAVFEYNGGIGPNLPAFNNYIFGEWLPNSGYELAGPDFEYYDNRFDPETGQGTFFIYVPVRAS